jgi:TolB-like protein/Tfp pilus assembly protein PilF
MRRIRIDSFIVEPALGLISGSETVHLEPKAMQVLLYLVARAGEVLSKQQIVNEVWSGTFVTDDALVRAVGALRRAFNDDPRNPRIIQTVPGRGYRLLASVSDQTTFRSLAVLPFENLVDAPEWDYFVEGISDALTTELAQMSGLKVISRTSAMRYKTARKPVPDIARELGVDVVVEGSVLKVEERVRISAQLIEGASDQHLWARSYERDVTDVLMLLQDVARQIVEEIRPRLLTQDEGRLTVRRPVDRKAYEAYLKGMFYLHKFTREGFDAGLRHLHDAVAQDPADPQAYAGLALGYSLTAHSNAPSPDAYPRARAGALKALELDETLADAQEVLAEVKLYHEWDFPGAAQAFGRALALNPNSPQAHRNYCWYLFLFQRYGEAIRMMERARVLDPLTALYGAEYAWMQMALGQHEEAITEARKALELDPHFPVGLFVLGEAHGGLGRYEEAVAAHEATAATGADWRWALGATLALAGQHERARRIAADLEGENRPSNSFGLAHVYAVLGERDEAFRCLEEAYQLRDSFVPWIRELPHFRSLHDDVRFDRLLRRIGLT